MLDDIAGNFLAFWVAVESSPDADAIVGMAGVLDAGSRDGVMGVPLPDFMRDARDTVRLASVRVAPERQRRGIGRALTQTAIDWARDTGYARLVLDTTTTQESAIALYDSMGFRRAGQTRFRDWDILWFDMTLVL